ncbi:trimethylamine dehydrogenase domain protein (plasmid) [Ochrobactrum quorumnocens]|uniref:Trimethylamine dehydrogenase domain protein n=1 Tax=Ochrobactrum quorumnocens TaxID=271865 RepID=A0A248UN43_9HYPH|nr:trimethylamine dehydrogenase domain protein [[Ochrobactrum] quorumnocens]
MAVKNEWEDVGLKSVERIGDCLSPGIIAATIFSGHAYAQSHDNAAPFENYDMYR